jgi:hypothetical protein
MMHVVGRAIARSAAPTRRFGMTLPRWITVFLIFGLIPGAASDTRAHAGTIQFQWTHQAQFAGLYAADQLIELMSLP